MASTHQIHPPDSPARSLARPPAAPVAARPQRLNAGRTLVAARPPPTPLVSPATGQLEITAIAHATRRAVVVFSADAPELLMGAEYDANGPRLKLAYHRHYYGLGEHYNSLVTIG
jgi:hypothetical protein